MPIGAAIGAAGALGQGLLGYFGSQQASKAQQNMQRAALDQQARMFGTGLEMERPFWEAGKSVLPTLTNLLTPGPNQTATLSQLPGFQFAQDWGQKSVQNIGSTLGFGGNTLAEGSKFATGLAQQKFGDFVNMLQNVANMGQSAAGTVFGNATQTGGNMAGIFDKLGGAAGAGILGGTNALSGAFGGASNALSLPFMLDYLKQQGGDKGSGLYGGQPDFGNSGFAPA